MADKLFLNLDIETTGLYPEKDFILEIAWQVLGEGFNPRSEPRSYIVDHGSDWAGVFHALRHAPAVVRNMHANSGLSAALLSGEGDTAILAVIAQRITSDLRVATSSLGSDTKIHLMGFSPQFDKSFLAQKSEFYSLLSESSYTGLNHRLFDLSSVKIAYDVAGLDLPGDWQNTNPHRAISDIEEVRRFALAVRDDMRGIHA